MEEIEIITCTDDNGEATSSRLVAMTIDPYPHDGELMDTGETEYFYTTVTTSSGDHESTVTHTIVMNPDELIVTSDTDDADEGDGCLFLTRKRQRNENGWEKNIKKMKKNSGEEYVSTAGQVVPKKIPRELNAKHNCHYDCTANFTEEDRMDINRKYWGLSDYGKQRLYINLTVIAKKCRHKVKESTRRNVTYEYRLNNKRVCREFYLATLNISEKTVFVVKKREKQNMDVTQDNRGKQGNGRKTTEEELSEVRDHINSFGTIPAKKRSSQRRYLPADLNITKMYQLFKNTYPKSKVKSHTYRKIFTTEFNLGFKLPIKDEHNVSGQKVVIPEMNTIVVPLNPEYSIVKIEPNAYKTTFKRPRNVDEWKRNVTKKKRNAGEAYITKSGQIVPEKIPIDCSGHSCRYKCNKNFTNEERFDINRKYWNLADYGKQRLFINLTVISKKCARKKKGDSRRQATYEYRLNDKQVCKVFYLATLHISQKTVIGVKNRERNNLDVTIDNRGKQKNGKQIPERELNKVRSHIHTFPTIPKRNSQRRYIVGVLSITKMYQLFKLMYPDSCVKSHMYRKIFNTEFNLAFCPVKQEQSV